MARPHKHAVASVGDISNGVMELAQLSDRSGRCCQPNFETSKRFYVDLSFKPRPPTDSLIEMRLGAYAFILQDYYVQQWADNFVMHLSVSDLSRWWDHILSLDLPSAGATAGGLGRRRKRDRSVGCALENCRGRILKAERNDTPLLMCFCREALRDGLIF